MSLSESVICPNCKERVPTDYVICPYCGYSLVETLREEIKVKIGFRTALSRIYRLIKDPIHNTEPVTQDISVNVDFKGPALVVLLFLMGFVMKASVLLTKHDNFNAPSIPIGGSLFSILGDISLNIIYFFAFYFSVFILIPGLLAILLWLFGIIFWRIMALVFHGICKALAGSGNRADSTSIIGYSLIPLFISQVIESLLLFILAPANPTVSPTGGLSFGLYKLLDLIILPFMGWSFYILYLGVKKTHRLPERTAMIASGSFIGFVALVFIFGFFG